MRILIALCVVVMAPALAQKGEPRDESLSCKQLQTEITTAMMNPAFQNAALQQQAGLTAVAAANLPQLGAAAAGSAEAVPATEPAAAPPAEEGKRKGGLFKKFGQAAGALGGGLGGGRSGAGALATAGTIGSAAGALGGEAGSDVASAAQTVDALGNLGALRGGGDKLGSIGAAAQTASALSGSRSGGGNLGNMTAAAAALQGGRGGLDATAVQALVAQQTQKMGTAQVPKAIADTPERMRAGHLFELATAKKCEWVPTATGGAER